VGSYFSVTSPPVLDETVTLPSEKPHEEAALAAPAKASRAEAIEKRILGEMLRVRPVQLRQMRVDVVGWAKR
jgi:hypothetical protein